VRDDKNEKVLSDRINTMKRQVKQIKHKNISYYFGNALLIISLLGFLYIFWPIVQIYLFPSQIQQHLPEYGMFVTIPKIHAQSPIIPNVDPNNQAIYDEALKHGVAQAKGTSLPGQKGTVYLFAHSSGLPWELTHFNTIFLRLGELQKGDEIIVRRNGKDYNYIVYDKKTVDPSQVSYLTESKKTQLIVQTCTPIGTSLYRLLIFAEPVF
jgi:LPXTG-site transpeptidase (sortase) family protein